MKDQYKEKFEAAVAADKEASVERVSGVGEKLDRVRLSREYLNKAKDLQREIRSYASRLNSKAEHLVGEVNMELAHGANEDILMDQVNELNGISIAIQDMLH